MAYKLFKDTLTPAAASYEGKAEKCIATFSTGPEQLDFVDSWLKNNLVSRAVAEVRNHDGTVLQVTIYRDAAPTMTTKWKVEITAGFPALHTAMDGYAAEYNMEVGFDPGLWAIIIGAIFVVLALYFVVRPIIQLIVDLVWGPSDRDPWDILANPWIWILGGIALVVVVSKKR